MAEVGRLMNVARSAEAVHMSQPAISQAITKLEAMLCVPLFDRSSRGMFLTDAGKFFHPRVVRALNFLERGALLGPGRGANRRARSATLSRQITSTQLRGLIAIEDFGSFSEGAKRIGTSQPSLHRAARDLETICHQPLFETNARGVTLSRQGEWLARWARLAFVELRQGLDELRALRGADTATLAIGALPLVRSAILPKAILNVSGIKPDLTIKVIDGPYPDLLRALRRGEIDILIGALRTPPPVGDVTEKPLFQDVLSVVARSGHPLAGRGNLSVDDLRSFPWIVPRHGTPTRTHFDRLIGAHRRTGDPPYYESSSLILVRGILAASDALTLISGEQVSFERDQGVLCILDFDLSDSGRPIGVTLRADWQPTATQRLFLETLDIAIEDFGLR